MHVISASDTRRAVMQGTPSASGRDVPVLPVDADPGQRLGSFVECDFLRRCAATYCELTPPPRSTIAAAFSPDGSMLASTQCVPLSLEGH